LQEDLPDWLQDSSETEVADEDTPPWVHREKFETTQPQQPTPTQPSDWKPVEPKPERKPKQSPAAAVQQPAAAAPVQRPVEQKPAPQQPAAKPAPEPRKKKSPPVRIQPEGGTTSLDQAKAELDRGDIPAALKIYGNLIKKGKNLDETIRDLTDSLYRYPVEVSIWQALGDAYMRANRLPEALEAYNKAEELIR
jgi:tetratricopeptide (TPR) repeat protein